MNTKTLTLLLLALLIGAKTDAAMPDAGKASFDVRAFGAVGDGKTLNTAAIQKAIDACHAAGGGRVVVPAGVFLTGSVRLKSRVVLRIEAGATLRGSPDIREYGLETAPLNWGGFFGFASRLVPVPDLRGGCGADRVGGPGHGGRPRRELTQGVSQSWRYRPATAHAGAVPALPGSDRARSDAAGSGVVHHVLRALPGHRHRRCHSQKPADRQRRRAGL